MSRKSTQINVGKKKLVILGGGAGGFPLARLIEKDKKLSNALDVVLVDKKEYYEINMASVRFLVDPKHHESFTTQYTKHLTKTKFVCGEVRTVHTQPQEVEVVVGDATETIPYDYLVIALGTRYPYFKAEASTLNARSEEVNTFAQQVRAANHILVVGGRSVGVEVVGEILAALPDKQITIVHPMDNLMDMWPRSGINKLNKFLAQKKKVTVVLRKKVARSEGNRHELDDGSVIEAEVKIMATGVTPNSEALQQFLAPALTPAGYVKVRNTLQLEGFGNIFAIGDIADLDMPKMAANIKAQLELVKKNLLAILNNKNPSPLGPPMMIWPGLVTLGPTNAILALPMFGGSAFQGKMLANMKTNMFLKMVKEP